MSEKIKIYTIFDRPEAKENPVGTEYDAVRQMRVDENGHKYLVTTGKTNRYEKIQSHAEETNIANILAKATMDPTALQKRNPQYFDATNMPKTLAEAQTKIVAIKNEFNDLPLEVRKKYDNSVEQYIADYGTENWALNVGLIKKTAEPREEKAESEAEA